MSPAFYSTAVIINGVLTNQLVYAFNVVLVAVRIFKYGFAAMLRAAVPVLPCLVPLPKCWWQLMSLSELLLLMLV